MRQRKACLDALLQPRVSDKKEEETGWTAKYAIGRLKKPGTADCMLKRIEPSSRTMLFGRKHLESLGKSI